jgi:hypothetical protein
MLVVAIDWSGARAGGGRREIAIAECDEGAVHLVPGRRSREEVGQWLADRKAMLEASRGTCEMVIGLDFAFSFPAWFSRDVLRVEDVGAVWDRVEAEAERWLEGSAPFPFWGRGEHRGRRELPPGRAYRLTELELARLSGHRPSSVFKLIGAGQVGPGSLRGMPILRALRSEGFAIWPFDGFAFPLVVEIYPRVLTGRVNKSSRAARRAHLDALGLNEPKLAERAASSEHAFDAACSALMMSRHSDQLTRLAREDFPYDVEGKIWAPRGLAHQGAGASWSVRHRLGVKVEAPKELT